MKITVEISDEIGEKIDLEAKKDGHSNRNAVIRKVLNLFFADNLQFSSGVTQESEITKQEQEWDPKKDFEEGANATK